MVPLPLVFALISALLGGGAAAIFIAACIGRLRRVGSGENFDGGDLEKGVVTPPAKVSGEMEMGVKKFDWNEIGRLTVDFSAPVIGRGGFSVVYLARLSDSELVAVKVHQESERLHRAFERELEVLLHVSHQNIVELLGYCDEKEEGALIFEYVPNGTLHEKLHGVTDDGERDPTSLAVLSWANRMSIAHEMASALEHLHDSCDLQIIHNDIKPSNILLDANLHSKLCDFGSAKLGFSSTVLVPDPSDRRRNVIGSPGYADPHYLRTGIASKKSDVYSFGILLLELVTGVEAFSEEKGSMLTKVAELVKERRVVELVDARLGEEYDVKEAKAVTALVERCVCEQPSLRPSMEEIVGILAEEAAQSISAVGGKDLGAKKAFSLE